MKCYIIGVMRVVKKILKKFGIGGIMNKFGKTLLTSLLVSSLAVSSVFAAPSVDDLKQNKEAAEKKVETLQDEMTSLMAEINTLEEELVQTGQEIIKATDDLQKAEEKEKTQYEEMKARIKIMYENGKVLCSQKYLNQEVLLRC